jgi:hypothetical protein
MRARSLLFGSLAIGALWSSDCGAPTCRSHTDCPFGYYCVVGGGSGTVGGTCHQDCQSASDCPQPNANLAYAVCSNEGKCLTVDRPPRLTVLEPETDAVYPEGTRQIHITGEVQTAAAEATVTVTPSNVNGCGGGGAQSVTLTNQNVGSFAKLSFVIDGVYLDPGTNHIGVVARVGTAVKSANITIDVDCPGCAQISIDDPKGLVSTPGLELRELRGSISPASVGNAIWRVHSLEGDVIDGPLVVSAGSFAFSRLPLFPGLSRLEVIVTGVGSGLGEARCSSLVESGILQETGVRLILLSDDSAADVGIHVIGPSGRFGDPMSSLSVRSEHPSFGGSVEDDFEGPEVATIEKPADGVYGVIIEPVIDGSDSGENALMHILFNGRTASQRPLGPRHLTALDGKLWVAGTLRVEGGTATWLTIDTLVDAVTPPTTPPSMWPTFH